MRPANDLARELGKIRDTLAWAERHFEGEGRMNAAAHMNERILFHPLAAAIFTAHEDAVRLVSELESEEE